MKCGLPITPSKLPTKRYPPAFRFGKYLYLTGIRIVAKIKLAVTSQSMTAVYILSQSFPSGNFIAEVVIVNNSVMPTVHNEVVVVYLLNHCRRV